MNFVRDIFLFNLTDNKYSGSDFFKSLIAIKDLHKNAAFSFIFTFPHLKRKRRLHQKKQLMKS